MMGQADHRCVVDLRGMQEGRHEFTLTDHDIRLGLSEDDPMVAPEAVLRLTLTLTGRLMTARGVVRARPKMMCARCLDTFEADLENGFDLVLRRGQDGLQLEDEEGTPAVLGDDWIAFDVSVRESLLLAIPLKPLCSEDCRGLCPQCGTNLNESNCDCRTLHPDTRWDALRSLLN